LTLLLTGEDVAAVVTDRLALEAMRAGFEAEAKGETRLPVRLDTPTPTGFLRVMPSVLERVMGAKVMTLVEGLGTRYLVLLFDGDGGDLLAILDADELTKLRTAATTALAGEHLVGAPPSTLGVLGTGFEARGHLAMLARLWGVRSAVAYSRSPGNRAAFAERMGAELGIDVQVAGSPTEVLASCGTVLLATKSRVPVLDGADLQPGAVVLSIGSTRPDLRELDRGTLARAETLLVDAVDQVLSECGDVIDALEGGAITPDRIVPLAEVCAGERAARDPDAVPADGRDVLVFKSVGTAVQDLALARLAYQRALAQGRGHDVGTVTRLKEFTS
jgi:alanine dehydrogenase